MEEEIKEIKPDETFVAKAEPVMTEKKLPHKKGLLVLIIAVVVLVLALGLPLFRLYADAKTTYRLALGIKDAAKSQDIAKTRDAVVATQKQLTVVQSDLNLIGWTRFIPLLGGYTNDAFAFMDAGKQGLEAAQITATAIEPYADLLGLKGQGSFTGGTTEERIAMMVETLDKVKPQIDQIAVKVSAMRKALDQVDPNRYPESFQGKPIRSQIVGAKEAIDMADNLLTEARPMVKQLPEMLGSQQPKKYMVLFQNDAELRPTGGFITAYAIFQVDKGKISLQTSDDIYKLDDTMTKHVAPPDPISRYLNVYGWRMRDANFSPDYYSSMKTFEDLYATSNAKQNIDGIIAMDTHVLVSLMNVLGPVDTYGTTFTTTKVPQCDCPMVIYELEKYADEPKAYERGSRKDIIGVLLQSLMKKAMTGSKQVYAPLFQAAMSEALQKHILFYVHNEDAQRGIEALNFGGRIKTYNGDYLHVNDANLAGAKSNLYIVPKVTKEVSITDSGADETLNLEYRYPHAADNCSLERVSGLCLAGIYRDYLRVYLPKGATITDVKGFESKSQTFDDLDHTVVDGFFTVVPEGLAKIQIKYKVAGNFKKNGNYNLLIQKQPGTDGIDYKVIVNNKSQEFALTEDKEINVKL
ncbi:DUF4012 domain-containing protein [Patescibacteria group bacterium]|nr:DUF4012 domain-containing protein [Patescibacteria group bacterium]